MPTSQEIGVEFDANSVNLRAAFCQSCRVRKRAGGRFAGLIDPYYSAFLACQSVGFTFQKQRLVIDARASSCRCLRYLYRHLYQNWHGALLAEIPARLQPFGPAIATLGHLAISLLIFQRIHVFVRMFGALHISFFQRSGCG